MHAKQRIYRAAKHVRLGVPDEHAYNMFLSMWTIWHRLGLWETLLKEQRLHEAWHRLINPMKVAHIKRKLEVQKATTQTRPYHADPYGNKVSP